MRALVFVLLFVTACSRLEHDPAKAVVVTEDVARFWQAFDAGIEGDLASALEQHYFGPGSDLLGAFREKRIDPLEEFVATARRNRRYYESVRANTLAVADSAAFEASVRAAFSRMKELDGEAVFAPTALLVGRMNSGGTTSAEGILIGLELFTQAADSPTDTLNDFERGAIRTSDGLVTLVAHENVHVLQAEYGAAMGPTLLEQALVEGVADFVAERVTGQAPAHEGYTFGAANEAAVWAEFRDAMDGTDLSRWLWNRGKDPQRAGDVGYFVGYRIAQAYAHRRGDDAAAVRELLRARDAKAILTASGYAGKAP